MAGYTPIGADVVDRRRGRLDETIAFSVRDFLESPTAGPAPWSIACNPPFDRIQEFAKLAVERARFKVAMLVPLRRLPAAHWLKHLPLETVYLLTPRPSMPPGTHLDAGGKAEGGSQDFCWLVFNKRDSIAAPRLRWLHRDAEATP